MTVEDPIVILGMPRSGTSMTAGIFFHHGCWVGRCRKPNSANPLGFFENLDFKALLKESGGRHLLKNGPVPRMPGFGEKAVEMIRRTGYEGGPWLVKHSALWWRYWLDFERPRFVCVRRSRGSNIASCVGFGINGGNDLDRIYDDHQREMDEIIAHHNGVNVDTERLVAGDRLEIEAALRHGGLEPDRRVIDDFVSPDLWHH